MMGFLTTIGRAGYEPLFSGLTSFLDWVFTVRGPVVLVEKESRDQNLAGWRLVILYDYALCGIDMQREAMWWMSGSYADRWLERC